MDAEFLALAAGFIIIGGAGIALFNGPITPSGDSCYCIIPSPEPGAAQGTSSIILVFGILFLPIGVLKGGLPTFGRGPPGAKIQLGSGRVVTPLPVRGGLFALGIAILIVGLYIVIPSFVIFDNPVVGSAGAAVVAIGLITIYFGSKIRQAA